MPVSDRLTFIDNPNAVSFDVDHETRTIRGLALPFGDVGNGWRFTAGVLTWDDRVKVLDGHDWSRAFGLATLAETTAGIEATIKVSRGARGDELLQLAEDGVYDGLSIGLAEGPGYEIGDDGVAECTSGRIREISLTPFPAFEKAKVTSVAASGALTTKEKNNMDQPDTDVADVATKVADVATKVADLATKFEAIDGKVEALADIKVPVNAGGTFQVKEEPIYRFAGSEPAPSGFDFATDLLAAAKDGDTAALDRIRTFTAEHYAKPAAPTFVDSGDTANVNPAVYRPDMFLGQAPAPTSPLYDTFHKGGLSSITPFFWSKLDRTATDIDVSDHTEGQDPSDTDFVTAVGATVTPEAVSGKVHITREVGDQGGNPAVSGMVWAEFDRAFRIALETKTAALITAAASSITSLTTSIAAGADGETLGEAIEAGLIDLQFIADGGRFSKAFAHVDLYKALASAKNSTNGEKLYPIINPQNRDGVSGARYAFIDVAGYRFEPAHSLGATSTSASNSYLADPAAVHVWNSGLQRLDKLSETVEGWDLGVFGYWAGIVYDVTGLRKIAYDPTA